MSTAITVRCDRCGSVGAPSSWDRQVHHYVFEISPDAVNKSKVIDHDLCHGCRAVLCDLLVEFLDPVNAQGEPV